MKTERKTVYKGTVIANYFIELGAEYGSPLTPMAANKLTSIAHGFFMALTGAPLIGEPVEAWQYGPVVRTVYELLRPHGRSPIYSCSFQDELECNQFQALKLDTDALHVIHGVWLGYGTMSGYQLSEISHEPGTPWHQVWHEQGGKERRNTVIPDGLIRDYYADQLQAEDN